MATVRTCLAEAMRALRATAPGDDPVADELIVGLEAAQNLILEIHEARGPLYTIDAKADYTAGENERVRVQAGSTVSVTLPNAIAIRAGRAPHDYGFTGGGDAPGRGSTGSADNLQFRAPSDGARIEIVGTSQAVYFYRADINAWTAATGLTLDSEMPLNARLTAPFSAMLAERLADVVTTAPAPSPMLLRRIARARVAIFTQPGRARDHRVGEYF